MFLCKSPEDMRTLQESGESALTRLGTTLKLEKTRMLWGIKQSNTTYDVHPNVNSYASRARWVEENFYCIYDIDAS